jgi:hypothetical protein
MDCGGSTIARCDVAARHWQRGVYPYVIASSCANGHRCASTGEMGHGRARPGMALAKVSTMTARLFVRTSVLLLACSLFVGCLAAEPQDEDDQDTASAMDVVPAGGGKADGTVDVVSGYFIYQNIYTPTMDIQSQPLPTGWVNLYSYLGTNLGQVNVDYYQSVGTVSRGACEEIDDMRHPFQDGRMRYDAYMCMLVLTKPAADSHGDGYVLVEYEEIEEADGSLTGEITRPYIRLDDNRATVIDEMPVNENPDTRSTVLVTVGLGTQFNVNRDALVSLRLADVHGNEAELRFQRVEY